MARRPEQSLDVLGQSLLSQQSARREKVDKRRRRDQKKLMIMGALVAGQSLVNSALKRRTKEIADLGEMSKYKSKMQAANMSFYAPIFQSMEGQDTYKDWNAHMGANPGEYRALQGHLSPVLMANAKKLIPGAADDQVKFDREYRYLKDDITNDLIEQAYGKHSSGKSFKELFNSGSSEFAAKTGVDPINKDALYNLLTNTTQNSLDAYKAREITARESNLETSIFSREALKSAASAATFNLIKTEKGESNPFKRISSKQLLIPETLQQVFDGYNVNKIIKDRFASGYAVMKDEVESFRNDETKVKSMNSVWENMPDRINRGTSWDVHRIPGTEKRAGSGHRLSAHSEDMIDNLKKFVDARFPIQDELLAQAGTLANMIGDPNRPKMKEDIMNIWLSLPHIKELGITKGDDEYRQVLSSLDSLIGRQEFALDFTVALSIRNEKVRGFEVDFSEIKSITEQKFKIVQDEESPYQGKVFGKKGNLKFETTDTYNAMNIEEKIQAYETYVKALLENQTRSNNTPPQLREVALKFMTDVPPPDGRKPEAIFAGIFEPTIAEATRKTAIEAAQEEANISMGYREPTPYTTTPKGPIEEEEVLAVDTDLTVDTMEPLAFGEAVSMKAVDQIISLNLNLSDEAKALRRTYYSRLLKAESNFGNDKDTFNTEKDARGIAQIVKSQALAEVQRRANPDPKINQGNGPNTRAFNKRLKEKYGIDLLTITPEQLDIPLYSIAVMEAYTASNPKAIPTDPIEQAIYYVDTYVRYDKEELGLEAYEKARNESIRNFLVNNRFRREWEQYRNQEGADFNYKSWSR